MNAAGRARLRACCAATAFALVAGMPAAAQAAMYRCPSPYGEGTVVTNGVDESTAAERGCDALQTRRSTLDGPARSPAPAAKAADDWITPRAAPARRVASVRPTPADSASANASANANASASASPEPTPRRIDPAVQRERDGDRRSILDEELDREVKARQALSQRTETTADPAQREPLKAQLQRHTANIDALQREISRLR